MISRFQRELRWSARISGLLLVCLLLLLLFGEGPPNALHQPPRVLLEFLAMLLMVGGFVAGWRSDMAGGLLAIGGFALFAAVEWAANGRLQLVALPLFVVPGVLYLASYGVGRLAKCEPKG